MTSNTDHAAFSSTTDASALCTDVNELRVAMTAATGADYENADIPTMMAAARARVAELEPQVAKEGDMGIASFELSMLRELLVMVTGRSDGTIAMH